MENLIENVTTYTHLGDCNLGKVSHWKFKRKAFLDEHNVPTKSEI